MSSSSSTSLFLPMGGHRNHPADGGAGHAPAQAPPRPRYPPQSYCRCLLFGPTDRGHRRSCLRPHRSAPWPDPSPSRALGLSASQIRKRCAERTAGDARVGRRRTTSPAAAPALLPDASHCRPPEPIGAPRWKTGRALTEAGGLGLIVAAMNVAAEVEARPP